MNRSPASNALLSIPQTVCPSALFGRYAVKVTPGVGCSHPVKRDKGKKEKSKTRWRYVAINGKVCKLAENAEIRFLDKEVN